MNVIWKTELRISKIDENDKLYVDLPVFSKILHVAMQQGVPCLWFVCDPKNKDHKESVAIVVLGTGHEFETLSVGEHLGTLLMHGESLVLHFFKPGMTKESRQSLREQMGYLVEGSKL